MVRIVWVSDADMTVRVHHVLLREDAVGNHEIPEDVVEATHGDDDPIQIYTTILVRWRNARS